MGLEKTICLIFCVIRRAVSAPSCALSDFAPTTSLRVQSSPPSVSCMSPLTSLGRIKIKGKSLSIVLLVLLGGK